VRPKRFVGIFCILLSSLVTAAQSSGDRAQALFEKAKGEDNDRPKQVQDYCSASQLEPKNKKYADTCVSYKAGLNQDDTSSLAIAIAAYKSHDLDRAESMARQVSSYDPKLSGDAKFLLDRIRNEKLLNQVKAAWAAGDFKSVASLSQALTNPDFKAAANAYVDNVNLYNGYIQQAQNRQKDNPEEAIRQLALAKALNPNGPDDPAGKISEIQKAMQAKSAPAPKPPADSGAETAKKVSKLLGDAQSAEQQGNLQDALIYYAKVLKLQPGNQDAQSNTERIEQEIRNDPAAARNELIAAIRYFYNSQFDDARRALMSYLESPKNARDPGAADFYLGAALLEQSILNTPRAQWHGPSADALSAFKEARKANYHPAREYVSPALLKVWDSTAP